jgi:NET1-associated nuclear protein 1 (U3 small nucleolar RNA-associated protein 17)
VTLGAFVVLYDPTTNAVLQVLTSAECPRPRSACFVGQGGRYVLVASVQNVVLWDLVDQSSKHGPLSAAFHSNAFIVRWHVQSPHPIEAIVAHPRQSSFVITTNTSTDSKSPTTMADVYLPASSTPVRSHTLPFRLRNVMWYPSAQTSGFSLVGVTQTWSVVLLGDDVHVPRDEGASTKELRSSGVVVPLSIFQDIFGPSAFVDFEETRPHTSTSVAGPSDALASTLRTDYAKFFDARAYLMPPLETMFDSLMDEFLTPRIADDAESEEEHGDATRGDDTRMDVDEAAPEAPHTAAPRIVAKAELDDFIELFQQHAVAPIGPSHAPPQPAARPPPPTPKANGIHVPKLNGGHPAPTPPAKVNGVVSPTKASSLDTPIAGKKRKKSLG